MSQQSARRAVRYGRHAPWTCLAIGFLFAGGCARPEQECSAPPLETTAVMPADLGISADSVQLPGEHPLDATRTVGRFPAGLSVARVVAIVQDSGAGRRLRPGDMPVERAAYWNQVMDTLPPIREVTQLRDLGIDPRGVEYGAFLRESSNINCNLCLIYGQTEDESGETSLVGALWDVKKRQPIAAYRVPIVVDAASIEDEDDPDDLRLAWQTAEAQAELDMRNLVRDSLWGLVEFDTADTTTQPSPWRDEDRILPRDQNPFRRLEELLKDKK